MPQFHNHGVHGNIVAQQFHEAALSGSNGSSHQPIRVGNYAVQQPRKAFQGASDGHLEELIQACNQPRAATGPTRDVEDVGGRVIGGERPLVPFFEAGDGADGGVFDWPARKHENGKLKANGAANGKKNTKQVMTTGGAPKHGKGKKHNQQNQQQVKSPKHSPPVHFQQGKQNRPGHVHAQQRNGKYAGSSFTVSPTPDRLPMPSKLL